MRVCAKVLSKRSPTCIYAPELFVAVVFFSARFLARLLLAYLFLTALLLVCTPQSAFALQEEEDPTINVVLSSQIDLDRVGILELPISTDPVSIEVGVPCGMIDMCGQDPCLCGPVDSYGACACNGLEEVTPTYEVEFSEEGIACAVEIFGTTYLLPLSTGEVDVVVSVSLPHYQSSSVYATVYVHPFGLADFLRCALGLLVLAAILVLVVLAVKGLVRGARVFARGVRRRRSAHTTQGKGEE